MFNINKTKPNLTKFDQKRIYPHMKYQPFGNFKLYSPTKVTQVTNLTKTIDQNDQSYQIDKILKFSQ